MAPESLLGRLTSPFREFGVGAGLLYLLDRLLVRLGPSTGLLFYEYMLQPIGDKPLLPPNLSKNLSMRVIGAGDPAVAQMEAREEIKAQRFEQGAQCLGAYRKGELMGYLWYAKGRYQEDQVRCDYLVPDTVSSIFDFDLFVLPQYRMGIGFMGVWHGANQVLAEQGIRHTFSRMTRFNLASRRAHARLGARCVGRAVFLKAWGTELMLGTLAPFVAFTWNPNQRVALTLRP